AGILADAEDIRRQMRAIAEPVPTGTAPGATDPRVTAASTWSKRFDKTHGGFDRGPKFLRPNVLSFLLHHGVRRGDKTLLENVYRTLDRMAAGGVRDQLGGAFHRYAVDRFWQTPHFEIMLDENAMLARLYLEAYQASARPRYAAVARAILDDLLARFRLPDGGFASALDSESEHQDGRYYTWTRGELRSALGKQMAARFTKAYLDQAHGLIRGRSVLRLLDQPERLLETKERLRDARSRLIAARAGRVPPLRDDKILTSWNALAVSAFAKAAQVLGDDRYRRVARVETSRLLGPAADRLVHSRRAGKTTGEVFLDDYAYLVEALIDLFETDFEVRRLDDARRLMKTLIGLFQTEPGKAFRLTPVGRDTGVPAKAILDEENVPSGNAAALIALHRLILFGGEAALEAQARAILGDLGRYLDSSAPLATGLLRALYFKPDEAREIVIVGDPGDARTRRLLAEVYKRPLIGTVLAVIAPDAPRENATWPLLAGRPLLDDNATAYVCKNRICDLPVDTPAALAAQLDKLVTPGPATPGN
ncbi:MAG: thioredoxin domain-containing protein, partial [Alphaproteobacteria bacterium]|nr:thioredoxin domain-containing protein [Alphaproteobacteria bacterium]